MFIWRAAFVIITVVVVWPAFAHPIGYQVPIGGGPIFADDHAIYAFVATHEVLESPSPEIPNAPPNTIPKDPIVIQKLSRAESVTQGFLGKFQIVYLPTWCGHRHSTDRIAYILRLESGGRQLVGRIEYESACHISPSSPYKVVCDSYHGAKGWSTQIWRGRSFQWAPSSG